MATTNEQVLLTLHKIYSELDSPLIKPDTINNGINYLKNNVFNLFLRVKLREGEVEIPSVCRGDIIKILNDHSTELPGEVVINLFENNHPLQKGSANAIFIAFEEAPRDNRLVKITTNKGEVYYGTHGLIFNKEFQPLVVYTLAGTLSNRCIAYNKARMYVHPSVFTSNGIVEKGIIKTVIPAFTTKDIFVFTASGEVNHLNSLTKLPNGKRKKVPAYAEIVITDVTKKFFVRPERPNVASFTKEAVNDFLLDHLDEVVKETKL